MHRVQLLGQVLAGVALAILLGGSPRTLAQDDLPTAGHPLVGTWYVDTNLDDTSDTPSLLVFHADGTMVEADPGGGIAVGAWAATGPSTADVVIVFQESDDEVVVATIKARAAIAVAADGDTFTADYTLEIIGADGVSTGEFGPARAGGERLAVEPMGTPVAPLSPSMGGADGTPTP